MFDVHLETETGLIRARCDGHVTVADIQEYGRLMHAVVERGTAMFGSVRVLVEANSMVQTAEVMDAVTQNTWQPGPNDRMAFVVRGMLPKMQAARLFDPARARPFLSEGEAIDWLLGGQDVTFVAHAKAS